MSVGEPVSSQTNQLSMVGSRSQTIPGIHVRKGTQRTNWSYLLYQKLLVRILQCAVTDMRTSRFPCLNESSWSVFRMSANNTVLWLYTVKPMLKNLVMPEGSHARISLPQNVHKRCIELSLVPRSPETNITPRQHPLVLMSSPFFPQSSCLLRFRDIRNLLVPS